MCRLCQSIATLYVTLLTTSETNWLGFTITSYSPLRWVYAFLHVPPGIPNDLDATTRFDMEFHLRHLNLLTLFSRGCQLASLLCWLFLYLDLTLTRRNRVKKTVSILYESGRLRHGYNI